MSANVLGWFEALLDDTGLLRDYPGYAGVLARMDPIATTTVPVAAVALRRRSDPRSRILLLINVQYFDAHRDQRGGILLHEIQHVLLGHLTNPMIHAVRHARAMEIAMEISADEPIAGLVPDHGFSLAAFAHHGIRAGQSTIERYRLLVAAVESGALRLSDFGSRRMRDSHRPGSTGAGGAGLGDLLDMRSDGASARNWNRKARGLGSPSSAATIADMKLQIATHLRGDRGGNDDPDRDPAHRRLPKELERVIYDAGGGREVVDWRRVVREVFPARRTIRPDHRRPNRRFPALVGVIPGRTRRPPKPALLVGIDTSGSMTGEILDRVAREVCRLAAHARVTVVECDAAVHRMYPFARPLGPFVGGGDTDFAPVFDELPRGGRELDGVVYFTDGRGAMPAMPPAVPVVWAVTHDGAFLPDWGTIVRLAE